MTIRKAVGKDLEAVLAVYAEARSFMASHGNPTQWGTTYPSLELLTEDISLGRLYVGLGDDGVVHASYVFSIGLDPSYREIREGAWLNDAPYGTIHRLASDGTVSGVFASCVQFCLSQISNLRADTHRDNVTMRRLLVKAGFTPCGIITLDDGTDRIAFQLAV